MAFRVPLLYPSAIVVSRLDIAATRAVDPPGSLAAGYDPDLREPIAYEDAGTLSVDGEPTKADARRYMAAVRIPCQVEVKDFEEVMQKFQGNTAVTQMVFVLHNKNLAQLGLTGLLKDNDRIDAVEKNGSPGVVVQALENPLYIFKIEPGSWGMGPTGQDLQVVYTVNRPNDPRP